MSELLTLSIFIEEYDEIEVTFKGNTESGYTVYYPKDNDYITGSITVKRCGDVDIISADISLIEYPYDYFRGFRAECAFTVWINTKTIKRGVALKKYNPFWSEHMYIDSNNDMNGYVQNLLAESDCGYIHFMPLSNELLNSFVSKKETGEIGFSVRNYSSASTKICGVVGIVAVSENPYDAVELSYKTAHSEGLIISDLRENKVYPEIFEGFGWCTWNAFYHDVTAEKIESKLKEFKEKGIPVKWILIDDGWSQTDNMRLTGFYEDKIKFPMGLKAFIQKIKKDYGIEYVGVWHSFIGYWFGIKPNSEVAASQSENLFETRNGILIPSGDYDKAYDFYNTWHSYLKECGVDFVKVDTQGALLEFCKNEPKICQWIVNMHKALDKSVWDNFGGNIINCMSNTNSDMFVIGRSSLVRNSDDFFPDKEGSFKNHLLQNAVGAIFNRNIFYCDYDMWWSVHPSAKESSVLRALSGGPVYVSDKVGESDKSYIMPILNDDGTIRRCEDAAVPLKNCLFEDKSDDIMLVYNRIDNMYVVGAFNLSNEKKSAAFKVEDLFVNKNMCAYYHFSNKIVGNDAYTVILEGGDCEIITLYPDESNISGFDKYILEEK